MAFDDSRPIYLQIADQLESHIANGILLEETQVPSTNELAAFHRINPATAGKGLAELVDRGIVYKKRGIGMFVMTGARQAILARHRAQFAARFLAPMLTEAGKLGIGLDQLVDLLKQEGGSK